MGHQESPPASVEVGRREVQAYQRQEIRAAKLLRESGRLSRRMLLGLVFLRGATLLTDVSTEKPFRHFREGRDFDEQDVAMFDAEAQEFLRTHEGSVNLTWVSESGKFQQFKVSGDTISKVNRIRFRESALPTDVMVTWQVPQSMDTGYQTVIFEDGNGNLVRAIRNATPQGTWITAQVGVMTTMSADAPNYSLSVDLRRLGGPEIRDLAEGEAIPSFARFGADGAYSAHARSLDQTRVRLDFERSRQDIGEALGETEKLFGLRPGQGIERLWLVDADEYNARAVGDQIQRQGTVLMSREMLHSDIPNSSRLFGRENTPEIRRSIARHEAFHIMDYKFSITGKIPIIHRVFRQSFVFGLSEARFLPEGYGGHAYDNEKEFFASLMADLANPDFAGGLKNLQPKEAQELYEAVSIVLGTIENIPELKGTPVLGLLKRRLAEIQQRGAEPVTHEVAQARHAKDLVAERAQDALQAQDLQTLQERLKSLMYVESREVYRGLNDRLKALDASSQAVVGPSRDAERRSLEERIGWMEKNYIFPKDWVRPPFEK